MIHRCQAVKDFVAAGVARRLHLERLPNYTPAQSGRGRVESLKTRRTGEPLLS